MLSVLLTIFSALPSFADSPTSDCIEWFDQSRIERTSKDCVAKCSTLKVDMGTFACPDDCQSLCKQATTTASKYNSVVDLAGLTKDEIALVMKSPREAKIVYDQVEIAQSMTKKRFGRDWYDDESDAYRHFMWTGLLIKELGDDDAQKFLDAHESANAPDDSSSNMDRKNNAIARKYADQLKKAGRLTADELDKAALKSLEKSELTVLRKLGGPKK